jgi:hypothetical protein
MQEARRMVEQGPSEGQKMEAIRAVLRAQSELALSGNGPAQRHFIKLVMEAENTAMAAEPERSKIEKDTTGVPPAEDDEPRTD